MVSSAHQVSTPLEVPGFTWIGFKDKNIAAHTYCIHCKKEENKTTTITNITTESHKLCTNNRAGILCGSCIPGYSLQLGGYKCGDCSSYPTYKGMLLLLLFIVAGIILIIVLFFLNLTVSSGLINGLIFYCNMIHSNTESFLPINLDSTNRTQLMIVSENMVHFLRTFQAWMNLDFGIVTCFFNGYNTYISTWMQFLFPLYIWLLILLIVLASRYSSKVSKLTTSNTVPVLATLMLLSYAKLLITCIEAIYFTKLEFLDSDSKHTVWLLDGSIPYLSIKHIPLMLMSILTITVYIVPFTLLLLLGPVLQAKSDHKIFKLDK